MEQYVKYLRKSRFDRDYADLSIEETLKRHEIILDKLANERGYHIAKTYYEVVSGESIAARPEIQKMLEEVSAGIYAGVLVVDLERLARGNGADQAYISQVFQFSATKIITPTKIYDPTNEFDEEYFEFGLFMSRREYKTINRRLIRGRDSSASEGKYLGSIAPYGYRRKKLEGEKGYTLEPHEEESEVVKKIFDMYTQSVGTKDIANYLNDTGIPTRHGDLWTYSTISNMVTNPVYMGKIKRGWRKQFKTFENGVLKKYTRASNDPSTYSLFDGLHPALVSQEVFEEAQRVRTSKAPEPKVKDEFEIKNAFSGLLFCGVCGKRIGRTTGSKSRQGKERLRCVNGRNCHNVSADYDVVEKQIIDALKAWYEGYKVKIETTGYSEDIELCKARISKHQDKIGKLQAQLNNAFDLIEQGVYTLDVFKERRTRLEAAIGEETAMLQEQTEFLERLASCDAAQSELIPQTETLLASYDKMTIKERNNLLKAILKMIKYTKNENGQIIIDLFPKLPRMQ